MAGAQGQAAGLAVGAAVGSFFGQPLIGASVGSGIGGIYDSWTSSGTQQKLDMEALKLNQAQYHAKAAAQGAVHAGNFRQALASQMALATMRGGSGSLASQFGNQAYRTFLEDQQAIEMGVKVADTQTALGKADIIARTNAARATAIGRSISAFDGVNLNKLRVKT